MIREDESVLPKGTARVWQKGLHHVQALIEHLKVQLEKGLEAIIAEALQLLRQDNDIRERLATLFQQAQSETDARNLQDLLTGLQVSLGGLEQSSESDKMPIMHYASSQGAYCAGRYSGGGSRRILAWALCKHAKRRR